MEGMTGKDSHIRPKGSAQSSECPERHFPPQTNPELLPLGYFLPFIKVSVNILSISNIMHEG